MTRWAVLPVMVLTLAAAPLRADAVTLQEIIDLSRAGLGEEALLALIEIDASVFPVDAATLQTLKKAGVSEKVIVAMIKSGRGPAVMPEQARSSSLNRTLHRRRRSFTSSANQLCAKSWCRSPCRSTCP